MKGVNNTYWGNIAEATTTLLTGLKLTFVHFIKGFGKNRRPIGVADKDYLDHEGVFTLQYPNETFPVPDNGRYRLHNEIEDCIVCDKCAKVCPVNCIDIEPIKSSEEIKKASDGSSIRLYAATFDIDMAKCMFCGLCTTVCPTECLTMTKTYDFSEFDVKELNYSYSNLSSADVSQKQKEWDMFQAAKKAKMAEGKTQSSGGVTQSSRPAMPKIGASIKSNSTAPKPKFVLPKPKKKENE